MDRISRIHVIINVLCKEKQWAGGSENIQRSASSRVYTEWVASKNSLNEGINE